MMFKALMNYADKSPQGLDAVKTVLDAVNSPNELSYPQGCVLAAVCDLYRPDVILDIGTGHGNSAAVFSASRPGVPVYTFDLSHQWRDRILDRVSSLGIGGNVRPMVGDLTKTDFTDIIGNARSVVVFWDAHGYDIAEHILGHVMPLIADRSHIVLCHDMSDARTLDSTFKEYKGKPMWRGGRGEDTTAYFTVSWVQSLVEQVIPILDFCWRNDVELKSVDFDTFLSTSEDERKRMHQALLFAQRAARYPSFNMGYFSMNGTTMRNFPPDRTTVA